MSSSVLLPQTYTALAQRRNLPMRARVMVLAAALATGASGCSVSVPLESLQIDPEATGSISRTGSTAALPLDGEDWRRAQSALSLAVDPQGPGLPVSWDNPASKRRGSFVQTGNIVVTERTLCRPFTATIVGPTTGSGAGENRLTGQACRIGPGEWGIDSVSRSGDIAGIRPLAGQREADQPLPARSLPMLLTADRKL